MKKKKRFLAGSQHVQMLYMPSFIDLQQVSCNSRAWLRLLEVEILTAAVARDCDLPSRAYTVGYSVKWAIDCMMGFTAALQCSVCMPAQARGTRQTSNTSGPPVNRNRLIALHCTKSRMREFYGRVRLVTTCSCRSQCMTAKDLSRNKAGMADRSRFLPDRLAVKWSILFFPGPLNASVGILRILAKAKVENWKIESFLWGGGRFGRSLLCPGRVEKDSGSLPTAECSPVDRNKLVPDMWCVEKGV